MLVSLLCSLLFLCYICRLKISRRLIEINAKTSKLFTVQSTVTLSGWQQRLMLSQPNQGMCQGCSTVATHLLSQLSNITCATWPSHLSTTWTWSWTISLMVGHTSIRHCSDHLQYVNDAVKQNEINKYNTWIKNNKMNFN